MVVVGASTGLTFASWNVHMGIHNDGGRNDVIAGVAALGADVVAMQEARWLDDSGSIADEVASALDMHLHAFTAERNPKLVDRPGWSIAILTRDPAERLDGPELPTPRSCPRREAVSVELANGLRVAAAHFFGVHCWRVGPPLLLRERAALAALACDHDIVMGDMNMWGPLVERNAGSLRRGVVGRSWPAWRPHSQIDHILVNSRLAVIDGAVAPNAGSDHRAVWSVVETSHERIAGSVLED